MSHRLGPGSVFRYTGILDTFGNFEWNFMDIGIQWFLGFGDTCS